MVKTERTLIYIPIAHSQGDMGTLGRRLPADRTYRRSVQAQWAEIERQVRALTLDWSRVKVYQDGLPDAGPEIINRIASEVQSPNYELLRWLAMQGAELVGTELPSLIKEEYDRLQAILSATDAKQRARARRAYAERAEGLLAERDAYVARRISETLPPAGVGLLFIGQAHRVAERLPADIKVCRLPDGPA